MTLNTEYHITKSTKQRRIQNNINSERDMSAIMFWVQCVTWIFSWCSVITYYVQRNDKNIVWKWLKLSKIHHLLNVRCLPIHMLVIFRSISTQFSSVHFYIEIYFDQVTCTTHSITTSVELMALINISIRYRMFLQWTQLYNGFIVVCGIYMKWNHFHSSPFFLLPLFLFASFHADNLLRPLPDRMDNEWPTQHEIPILQFRIKLR